MESRLRGGQGCSPSRSEGLTGLGFVVELDETHELILDDDDGNCDLDIS